MLEIYSFIWLICLNILHTASAWPACPSPDTIYPCNCNTSAGRLICGKTISSNLILKQIFQESSRQTNKLLIFQKFIFQDSIVDQIESDSFDKFAFREMSIDHNDYLEFIDENAFKSTYNITDKVYFESNPSIGLRSGSAVDFFKMLSHFRNASLIHAIDCGLQFIPDNAFRPLLGVQSRLQRLSLAKNRIINVGNFGFSNLPNINYLNLQQNLIENLNQLSLVVSENSEHIFIDLSKNRLTSSSFDSESLASIDRPFDLQLSDNSITFLNESIFKHLFKRSITIKLWRNPINCSDCRLKWTSNEKQCIVSNNTISFAQRIEFQCKLFKDNFRRCQNTTDIGIGQMSDNPLACPLVRDQSHSVQINSYLIFASIVSLVLVKREYILYF